MNNLILLDQATAPDESKPLLENSVKAFGMIPNLHAVMAAAPATLNAYQQLHSLFQTTSFNAEELTVVWQTINVEHECHYCIPAHTMIAHSMKVNAELIESLNNKHPLPSVKLQALHDITLEIVRNRGKVSNEDVQAFYNAGYKPQQLLEIIVGVAQKVMSNYINHLADTPIDEPFKKFA